MNSTFLQKKMGIKLFCCEINEWFRSFPKWEKKNYKTFLIRSELKIILNLTIWKSKFKPARDWTLQRGGASTARVYYQWGTLSSLDHYIQPKNNTQKKNSYQLALWMSDCSFVSLWRLAGPSSPIVCWDGKEWNNYNNLSTQTPNVSLITRPV